MLCLTFTSGKIEPFAHIEPRAFFFQGVLLASPDSPKVKCIAGKHPDQELKKLKGSSPAGRAAYSLLSLFRSSTLRLLLARVDPLPFSPSRRSSQAIYAFLFIVIHRTKPFWRLTSLYSCLFFFRLVPSSPNRGLVNKMRIPLPV